MPSFHYTVYALGLGELVHCLCEDKELSLRVCSDWVTGSGEFGSGV